MKKEPLVSIIIPMYNAQKFIRETLDSLLQQQYKNIEVIVVDNASTDNSIEIIKSYKEKLKIEVIKCSHNSGGPAKPRNIGIDNSSGEYISFLGADDLWEPSKLIEQINIMVVGGYNFTCMSPISINEKSIPIKKSRNNFFSSNKVYGLRTLLFRNTITTSSVVIKKDFLGLHRFNESKYIVTCEDYLLWLNLFNSENCLFLHITKKLVRYRVMSTSLGNKDGMYFFAAKSLLASSEFLVKNKMPKLMYITICSNIFRLFKLWIFRCK